jgi:hypothetical protein
MPLTRHVSFRLTPEGHRRLQAIAQARYVSPGHAVRQLIDEVDVDVPAKPRRELSEAELLDLLRDFVALNLLTEVANPSADLRSRGR